MLKDKKIIVGITASIAAYKSILLVRALVKAGASVQVIMTPAAKDFVTTLTLSTLSKKPVLIDLFNEESWENHVALGRWADLFIIAPASCNTIAKMANGFCDNLLLATYLSATCPVVLAPAMDEDMWQHPATMHNLQKLQSYGNHLIPVGTGELASGLFGAGRMAEPEEIISWIEDFFSPKFLKGKKILITAGPTYEAIDPVRFIGNRSTGKMGIALATEAAKAGARVQLVLGPSAIKVHHPHIEVIPVESAAEMYEATVSRFSDTDIAILSAAVADYSPTAMAAQKIKKQSDTLNIELTPTKDILATLGSMKSAGQKVVGFALETHEAEKFAKEKMIRKNADMIVLNNLNDPGAGFGYDTNVITIFTQEGTTQVFPQNTKQALAVSILETVKNIISS